MSVSHRPMDNLPRIRVVKYNHKKLALLQKSYGTMNKKLAELLDVTPETIRLYLNGSREPKASHIGKLAAFFHVSPDYFFDIM